MSLQTLAAACVGAENEQITTDNAGASEDSKPAITRQRQQLSCSACHARKQKCDRNQPCGRCVARKVADQCHVAPRGTNKVHRRADGASGSDASASKKRKLQDDRSRNGSSAEDVSSAGHLVPQLNGDTPTFNFLGSSSVVDFIGRSMAAQNLSFGNITCPLASASCAKPQLISSTITSILAQLPNRVVCDRLIDEFYKLEFLMWLFAVAHRPYFDLCYRAMWEYAPASPFTIGNLAQPSVPSRTLPISFVANTLMMMTIALQFLNEDLSYLTGGNTEAMKEQMYLLARHALIQSELQESPDRCRAETILMFGVYAKNEGNAGEIFSHVASAIRVAQSIGMHRKSAPGWNITPLEEELRRRAWAALYTYDRFSSIGYGRPYVINDQHCDQESPANIDTIDLTPEGPRNIKPFGVVTDTTFLLLQVKYAKILGKVFEECFSIKQPTYATVLQLDSELHTFEVSLPLQFRAPSTEDMYRQPKISMHYGLMTAQICKGRQALHRPFLLRDVKPGDPDRYAKSKVAAVNLAKRALHAIRDIQFALHPKFFFVPHVVFDAAASLCVAASLEKRRDTYESLCEMRRLDETVKEAIALLHSIASSNRVAKESYQALKQLRSKLYAPEDPMPTLPTTALNTPNTGLTPTTPGLSASSDYLPQDVFGQNDSFGQSSFPGPNSFGSLPSPESSMQTPSSSSNDIEWQVPLPAVTYGDSASMSDTGASGPSQATTLTTEPVSTTVPGFPNADFLNAPTDLSFPSLFDFMGDSLAFEQVMDTFLRPS